MSQTFLPYRAVRAGRVLAWTFVALLAGSLLLACWVGVRGALAYQHLDRMQASSATIADTLSSDSTAAAAALSRAAADAESARDLTSDPLWAISERLPWVGPQLSAFRTIATSSDVLLREALLPLFTAAQGSSIDGLKPVNGHIDTQVLASIAAPAAESAAQARCAADAVRGVERGPLLGIVSSAVDRADDAFGQMATAVDTVSRASKLLPSMLGEDGTRNYLVLVQNNAEWRSLGGISGTAILLRADKGQISLVNTESATSLSRGIDGPVVDLPEEIRAIYGTRPARYFHNLTQIPDFTVDGPMAREMYKGQTGVAVDGVIAMDPVVLSYLLEATGTVQLPTGGSLTAANAVPLLLNQVYIDHSDPATQDAVFAGASAAVFEGLLSGNGSAAELIAALARASVEHRLLIWSERPEEQGVLSGSDVAGQLPVDDAHTARFGIFLNDGSGSKMSYYVKPSTTLTWGSCQLADSGQARQLRLTTTLTNAAPEDAGSTLPGYITGDGAYGTVPGEAKVITNFYLPAGSTLVSTETGDFSTFASDTYEDRQVLTLETDLAPGASKSATVVVKVESPAANAEAFVTPTADSSLATTVTATCTPR